MYFKSIFSALLFLLVTAMCPYLNVQAATNIHSHPSAGGYRAPAKALLDLGIATTKILSNGVWIYWNSQTEPDHLIASLKQKFPGGFALEHNDPGTFQISPPPETGLPKIIIYPSPAQPEPHSWLTPSKPLSLVNRETLHTVAQAFHYLTTGEAAPSVETDPASRDRARHLATKVPFLKRLHSSSQTPTPTPLGWDDDNEAFLFRQKQKMQLSDSPSVAQSEINDTRKYFPSELTVKPSPTTSVPVEIRFNQDSHKPKAASVSSTQASPSPSPSPSPSAAQSAPSQSSPGPASSSGASSVGIEGTHSFQAMKTEVPTSTPIDSENEFTEKHIQLGGEVVRDYSHHRNFHTHMKKMTFSEAEAINKLINQYPDQYPMPGMVATAEQMIEEIARMKARKDLRPDDINPLDNLEQDVIQLNNEARYPYRQSLILSYRFLHYKALLDYREQVETHAKSHAEDKDFDLLTFHLRPGVRRISSYARGCSLRQLEQIGWQNMLKDDGSFTQDLSQVYYCKVFERSGYNGFQALASGIPLIPCPHELDISFFTCTVGLPLWLVGFSLAEKTRADGLDMGCSGFFDHDLYHLALTLYRLKSHEADDPEIILNSIRHLYACESYINTVSFKAVELVIFYYFHEQGATYSLTPYNDYWYGHWLPDFNDLPPEYQHVTRGQVRQAHQWLRQLRLSSGDSPSDVLQKVKTNEESFVPLEPQRGDDEVYPGPPPVWITSLIESIRNSADQITSYGLNYRHMIDLLCKYSNTKSIPENPIDCDLLFTCADYDQSKEAQWLACYNEVSSSKKSRDFETLLLATQQLYSQYGQSYKKNLQTLLSVCRNTVENFVEEAIRRFPGIAEKPNARLVRLTHELEVKNSGTFRMTKEFQTYSFYLMLRDNYAGFWEKQDQTSPREPRPIGFFFGYGLLKDGRVHIAFIQDRSEQADKVILSLKKAGYMMIL